jgi:hypothetical protein
MLLHSIQHPILHCSRSIHYNNSNWPDCVLGRTTTTLFMQQPYRLRPSGESYVKNFIAASPKLATILQRPPPVSDLERNENRISGAESLFPRRTEKFYFKDPIVPVLPTRKIAYNLKKLNHESRNNNERRKIPVVLVLGGSFNPSEYSLDY